MENKAVREKVLDILVKFIVPLSLQSQPAAYAVLVAGNAVAFTVRDMTDGGVDAFGNGVALLHIVVSLPQARQRLSTKGVVDQLLRLVAKRLEKVRDVAVVCRNVLLSLSLSLSLSLPLSLSLSTPPSLSLTENNKRIVQVVSSGCRRWVFEHLNSLAGQAPPPP